tara:strand:+ start:6535 stop:7164 length:630 start_codon:yes stop_codon:yes gene_type:complete
MKKENMELWDKVFKTDPKYTKNVKYGARSFTTINAQYQIKCATEVFGAYGEGWGVRDERFWSPIEGLLGYQAIMWYACGTKLCELDINSSINTHSGSKLDDECFKKVTTDALTKGLSKLGFNADIFMGLYDDNRYVVEMQKEFAPPTNGQVAKKTGPYTLKVGDKNWGNVLKYVTVNKTQGVDKLADTLQKKYKITAAVLKELTKVVEG